MFPNRRFLKGYIRIDASGRIIPGSAVLRKRKPLNGRWAELDTYLCCDGISVSDEPQDAFPYTTAVVSLTCSGGGSIVTDVNLTAADVAALPAALNASAAGALGTFSLNPNGTEVDLMIKQSVVDSLCPDGTITMAITAS